MHTVAITVGETNRYGARFPHFFFRLNSLVVLDNLCIRQSPCNNLDDMEFLFAFIIFIQEMTNNSFSFHRCSLFYAINIPRRSRGYFRCGQSPMIQAAPQGA